MKAIIYSLLFSSFAIAPALADGVGTTGPNQFPQQTGKALFENICQSCHMPNAKGAEGAGYYPALAGDPNLQSSMFLAYVIMYGRGGMPGFGGVLDDTQISEVTNYVRSNFGNNFEDKISTSDVTAIRKPNHEFVDMN